MKNINAIINAVLGAAVIVLFVLHFTGGEQSKTEGGFANKSDSTAVRSGDLKIAYFNVDSVLTNWELYYEMQEELAARQTSLETEFGSKQQAFVSRVEDAQYKMQRGLVTRAEAEQLQQQLAQEEQGLMALQNDFALQLQEEGVVKNRQMIDKLEVYLKKFNQSEGYTYIFSYAFGGNLLYGDEAFDITQKVIEGINSEYSAEESE